MKTKCLFGGALLGAGLCGGGSPALAGNFDLVSSYGFAMAFIEYSNQSNDFDGGDFALSVASSGGTTASAYGDSYGFSFFASGGNAYARTLTQFSVSSDLMVLFQWDVISDTRGLSYGKIVDLSTGSSVFEFDGGSGDTTVTLLTGRTYSFRSSVVAGSGSTADSSFNVSVVPLPPAAFAGLGMLAGMGAYKRIRRR